MKIKGMIRPMDNLGRISIPKEYRQHVNVHPGSSFDMTIQGGSIILTPYQEQCILCGDRDAKEHYIVNGRRICPRCKSGIENAWIKDNDDGKAGAPT